VAVSGVVAALSLAVALTVMVASFRQSVSDWLDVLLPADLYLRTSSTAAAADTAFLTPALVQGLAQLDSTRRGRRWRCSRVRSTMRSAPCRWWARPCRRRRAASGCT
jgi:putative ABC transport system permease protein